MKTSSATIQQKHLSLQRVHFSVEYRYRPIWIGPTVSASCGYFAPIHMIHPRFQVERRRCSHVCSSLCPCWPTYSKLTLSIYFIFHYQINTFIRFNQSFIHSSHSARVYIRLR